MCIVILPLPLTCKINLVDGMNLCYAFSSGSLMEILYYILLSFLYTIIPFCIISVLNILIFRKIKSQNRFKNNHQKSKNTKTTNLTLTMFAVCVVFIITTLPMEILSCLRMALELFGTDLIAYDNMFLRVASQMDTINHSINFLLYCLTGSVFRQTLVRVCQSCRKQNLQSPMEACPTVDSQV